MMFCVIYISLRSLFNLVAQKWLTHEMKLYNIIMTVTLMNIIK